MAGLFSSSISVNFHQRQPSTSKLDLFPDILLTIGPFAISPVSKCRNLGVLFNSGLKMEQQVKSVAKTSFYHLRLIARICRFLEQSAAKALVHAFVLSPFDYCNSLFADLTESRPAHTYILVGHFLVFSLPNVFKD